MAKRSKAREVVLQVLYQDDVNAGATWHGKVVRIADGYSQRRPVLNQAAQFNDVRTLEVIIRLEKSKSPLRIGQRVRVTLDGN